MPRNGTASKTSFSTSRDNLPVTLSADILLAEYEDIVDRAVLALLDANQDRLPDLSPVSLLTPTRNLAPQVRK